MRFWSKIVTFFRNITNTRECIEVWDTSALSHWLDMLVKTVDNEKIKVIITEGVIHELSVGRHKFEKARNAYFFVKDTNKDNLVRLPTDDKVRTWTVDEQVVYVAEKYRRLGHDVMLVTCDQCQAFRAELKGIKVKLLEGNREIPKNFELKQTPKIVATVGKRPTNKFGGELKLDYKKQGNDFYIPLISRMEIYDTRGKRRVGKNETIQISKTDKVVYYNCEYMISEITDNKIILTRC